MAQLIQSIKNLLSHIVRSQEKIVPGLIDLPAQSIGTIKNWVSPTPFIFFSQLSLANSPHPQANGNQFLDITFLLQTQTQNCFI